MDWNINYFFKKFYLFVYALQDKNALVLQTYELSDCHSTVNLQINGFGSVLVQFVTSYNIPSLPANPSFTLSQEIQSVGQNKIELRTCVTYHAQTSTGMTLIEAYLVSGYDVNKAELESQVVGKVAGVQKVEVSTGDKVVFYLTQLNPDQKLCIDWKMYKSHQVSNLKPVPVKVYDYYNNALQTSIIFELS